MSEVAISLVLMVGAGLLVRSFANVQALRLGFQTDHVLTVGLGADMIRHNSEELMARLQKTSGVEGVAVGQPPLAASTGSAYAAEGSSEMVKCGLDAPSAQYFRVLRIPVLEGRLFTEQDNALSEPVVILNRTAARRSWPGVGAVGKRLRFDEGRRQRWLTVAGVIEDVRAFGLERDTAPHAYVPFPQTRTVFPGTLLIRTRDDPRLILPTVRSVVRSLDAEQPLTRIATMEELLSRRLAPRRFNTLLMSAFAALAFLLAASGVYSLMSYTVALRTREVSVRLAVGASPAGIVRMLIGNGALLAGVGAALGVVVALAAVRLLAPLLYQVKPTDPVTFLGAMGLLAVAALVACYLPARRASRVDVVEMLRQE